MNEEEGKYLKTDYYDLKRRILRWENNNYAQIAILCDTNGMHKMFDHSAIIFVCQIAKRLRITANLSADTDFEIITDKPVFLCRNTKSIERGFKEIGIKLYSSKPNVMVYELGYIVEPSELKAMMKECDRMREMANKLILPVEVFPALRVELYRLADSLYQAVRPMELVARTAIGDEMLRVAYKMTIDFVGAVNGHEDIDVFLKSTAKNLRYLDAAVGTLLNTRLVGDDKCLSLIRQLSKTKKKVAGAIEKRELDKKRMSNANSA